MDASLVVRVRLEEFIFTFVAGLVVAGVSCWYTHKRARALGPHVEIEKKMEEGSATTPQKTLFAGTLAVVFYLARLPFVFHRISGNGARYEGLRAVLMLASLTAVLILASIPRTSRFATSAAVGVGFVGLLTLGGVTFFDVNVLIGTIFVIAGGALKEPEFWVLAGFLTSCVVLAIVALSEAKQRSFSIVAMAVGGLWTLGINPAVGGWKNYDAKQYTLGHELAKGGPYLMYRAESCLLRYKAKQRGGFPETLAEIDKSIPGCLQAGMADGRELGGYRVEYRVTGSAPYAQFSLTALPRVHSPDGTVSFFADETGIVRTSSVAHTASATDGGVTPAEEFGQIERCIANYTSRADKSNKFGRDPNVGYDAQDMHYPDSFADMFQKAACFMRDLRDGDRWKGAAYRYTYQRVSKDVREDFVLTGRPLEYGVTGLRSYFVDNHFIVHATAEDREATEQDGWASRCELFSLGTPCKDDRPQTRPVTEKDLPADDPRYKPPTPSMHEGGLAEVGSSKLFWNSNQDYLSWVGASEDGSREYIGLVRKGILALSSNGAAVWMYPEGTNGLVAGASLYAANENGILTRFDETGKEIWSFDIPTHDMGMQFRDGILYLQGNGIYAIGEDGQLRWRMKLPGIGGGAIKLSDDGKRLYVVDGGNLHKVDAESGTRLWSVKNECFQQAGLCHPEELANGSIALLENNARGVGNAKHLRLINAKGAVEWSEEYPARVTTFEYVVPRGANTIVVSAENTLTGQNARGEAEWTLQGFWQNLSASRRAGLFYANLNTVQKLMDAKGQVKYEVPRNSIGIDPLGPFGKVQEVGDDLLLIEKEYHSIWTARLPNDVGNGETRRAKSGPASAQPKSR